MDNDVTTMKVSLDYGVQRVRAPGETQDSAIPVIVDRYQPTDLERVIEKCIDRGLIAGIKPTAARTIAEGIAQQMAHEFKLGNGVLFGNYFYGRPYLSGTVDANGRLNNDNSINVRLYKGEGFRLSRKDFSLSFADAENNPKITNIVGEVDGVQRKDVVVGENVVINGKNLCAQGETVVVKFADISGATAPVSVSTFATKGAALLKFTCPEITPNKEYSVSVERTDEEGVTLVSRPYKVKVLRSEAPVPAPTITSAGTRGDGDGFVNIAGTLDVTGTNLDEATEIQLLRDSGEPWQTVQATYADGKLTAELDFQSKPCENGAVRVTTPGGSATYEVVYGDH